MLPNEAAACLKLLGFLASSKHVDKQRFFAVPVQAVLTPEEWDAYTAVVTQPRDLGTIQKSLEDSADSYATPAEFVADVNLCFDNAIMFNQSRYPHIATIATQIKKVFHSEVDKRGLLTQADGTATTTPAKPQATIRLSVSKKGGSSTTSTPTAAPKPVFDPKACEGMLRTAMAADATARLFAEPVDESVLPGYRNRIDSPMDFSTLGNMLQNKSIGSPEEFAVLMRRIFANALRFNYRLRGPETNNTKAIRAHAKTILFQFESEWKATYPTLKRALPELKECLVVIDDLMKVHSTDPGTIAAADSFIDPISKYYGGQFPDKYLDIVKKPMDIGTVISNLIEGGYSSVEEMRRDMLLVFSNCEEYLNSEGVFYLQTVDDDAKALRKKFVASMEANVKSTSKPAQSATATSSSTTNAAEAAAVESASRIVIKKKAQATPAVVTPTTTPTSSAAASQSTSTSSALQASTTSAAQSSAEPSLGGAAVSSTKSKAPKIVVKDKYLWCLDQLRQHYIQGPVVRVRTADPFLKAVDPTKYAGYAEIVLNPMDLTSIERKVRGDRYANMLSLLRDVRLIRHNTYLYNTGIEGLEIRVLADHLVFNFTYLLTMVASEIAMSPLSRDSPQFAVITDEIRDLALQYQGPQSMPSDLVPVSASAGKEVLGLGIQEAYILQPDITPEQIKSVRDFYSAIFQAEAQSEPVVAVLPKPKAVRASTGSKSQGQVPDALAQLDQQSISDVYKDTEVMFAEAASPVSGSKAAKGKVASKSSRKSTSNLVAAEQYDAMDVVYEDGEAAAPPTSVGLAYIPPVPSLKPMTEWELACVDVVKKVLRHDFVDLSRPRRPGSLVCDFIYPVIQMYPSIAEKYLEIIKTPMDLTTVRSRLEEHSFLDCDDFLENITLVFQNAVDYNRPHASESEDAARLVPRCEHMIQYVLWLCLEYLPCKDDSKAASEEEAALLGPLRKSIQKREREFRTSLLKTRPIDDPRECNALLKKFENRKFIKEYIFFAKPVNLRDVPNYSNFVRKPMDFSTIKAKLESSKYPTYYSLIEDIELIFNNAKRFNGAFQESDPISKRIYEAAEFFQDKLNHFVYREFSIDVSERHIWNDFKLSELGAQRLEKQKALDKQRLEDAQFRQQEVERLKKIDQAFAIDQDRELKRAYALENIPRPTERASRSAGVGISAGFSFEDKERRLQAEAALRDQMFEAAWARWTAHYGAVEAAAELEAAEAAAAKAKEDASAELMQESGEISGTPPSKKQRVGDMLDGSDQSTSLSGHYDELKENHERVVLQRLVPVASVREQRNIPSVFGADTDLEAESSDDAMDVCEDIREPTKKEAVCLTEVKVVESCDKANVIKLDYTGKAKDGSIELVLDESSNRRIILHAFPSDSGIVFLHFLVPQDMIDSNELSIETDGANAAYRLGTQASGSLRVDLTTDVLSNNLRPFADVLRALRERASVEYRGGYVEQYLGAIADAKGHKEKFVLEATSIAQSRDVSFKIEYEGAHSGVFLEDDDPSLQPERPGLSHLRGESYLRLGREALLSSACHKLQLCGPGGFSGDYIGHWLVLPSGSRLAIEASNSNRLDIEL